MTTAALSARNIGTRLLWLDLTRSCQLHCVHCYNGSGPQGGHGAMTREDWLDVLDQAAGHGITHVQFIGGEPTMHPDFPGLADRALDLGLDVEVFTNLVHVSRECWELFRRDGVSLATSYYSDQAAEHNAMTRRPSHGRTRANIEQAVCLGIPVRVGIVTGKGEQHVGAARSDLEGLGVTRIGVDHVRPFGRGAGDHAPDMSKLCGDCGNGKAAIGPDGTVSPCVFSGFMDVGNVRAAPLADILGGVAMAEANATVRSAIRAARACMPDTAPCSPDNAPPQTCGPDDNAECSPGTPPSTCNPRR
ncbi:radical SAM/SPASM domain-containing protein [Actinacidiphila acididurans]|uniref:radical SAM/SPASM domain-containing protein n=1 Tax=Actinacidiphila acididurans TaxID=2784346 RepID=UPI0027DC2961|nr:radical SAM/SPASM domain-containing protein [Actinacidiphila acididurans]